MARCWLRFSYVTPVLVKKLRLTQSTLRQVGRCVRRCARPWTGSFRAWSSQPSTSRWQPGWRHTRAHAQPCLAELPLCPGMMMPMMMTMMMPMLMTMTMSMMTTMMTMMSMMMTMMMPMMMMMSMMMTMTMSMMTTMMTMMSMTATTRGRRISYHPVHLDACGLTVAGGSRRQPRVVSAGSITTVCACAHPPCSGTCQLRWPMRCQPRGGASARRA
jgi:hypothetical protein